MLFNVKVILFSNPLNELLGDITEAIILLRSLIQTTR
jgi:hypothetical protein